MGFQPVGLSFVQAHLIDLKPARCGWVNRRQVPTDMAESTNPQRAPRVWSLKLQTYWLGQFAR